MLHRSILGLDTLVYLFNVCWPTWGLCTPRIWWMSLRRPEESTESLELELWSFMWVLGTKPKNSKINSGAMSLPLRGLVFLTSFKKSKGKGKSKRKEGSRPEGWWCRRALIDSVYSQNTVNVILSCAHLCVHCEQSVVYPSLHTALFSLQSWSLCLCPICLSSCLWYPWHTLGLQVSVRPHQLILLLLGWPLRSL